LTNHCFVQDRLQPNLVEVVEAVRALVVLVLEEVDEPLLEVAALARGGNLGVGRRGNLHRGERVRSEGWGVMGDGRWVMGEG